MDLIKRLRELFGTEYPYTKEHRLRVVCTDGKVLTGKFCCVIGALDNEPEINELDIRRDDNLDLTGLLETEIESIELLEK